MTERLNSHGFAAAVALIATPFLTDAPSPAAAQASQQQDGALVQLVRDFIDAESHFDQKRLGGLITDDYVEISPLGEVDPRAEFLGFYAADKKRPVPATSVTEPVVAHYGDTGSIIVKLSFAVPGPDGQPRAVSVRASYLAVRSGGEWKLARAQFTPERPKAAAPAK